MNDFYVRCLVAIFFVCVNFSAVHAASLSKINPIYEVAIEYSFPADSTKKGSVRYSFTNHSALTYRPGAIELEYVCGDQKHRDKGVYIFEQLELAPQEIIHGSSRGRSPCRHNHGITSASIKRVGFTQEGLWINLGQQLVCDGKPIQVLVEMLKSGKHFRFRTSHGLTAVIEYADEYTAKKLANRLCSNPDQKALQYVKSKYFEYMRSRAEGCQKDKTWCLGMYEKINKPNWDGSLGVRG